MTEKETVLESKLVPVLREGVEVVKMVLYMKLKSHLTTTQSNWQKEFQGKIIGAVINDIFGIKNQEKIFDDFAKENRVQIAKVIDDTPVIFSELLITLTDSLRIMVLCDHQEGVDSSKVLADAQARGLLLVERELPMPHTFIDLVRRLASYYGLYVPPADSVSGVE